MSLNSKLLTRNLLKMWRRLTLSCENTQDSVAAILGAIVKKGVQCHYSATGKGKDTKKFRDTNTFRHMRDVIFDYLRDNTNETEIKTEVSTWLSRSGDREGGRRARK
ncbi:uncharacterized protein LOC117176557 [Belonocnema kinseyi]|uniref:uncharacterized protein LOC117176557 n=1 Tax=Belonocnema kinseyi TaxID=2817044 RepID=UPI00143D9DD7|nr:uncharacterized protein LOC117176557 [Belonocnema kinseyi]